MIGTGAEVHLWSCSLDLPAASFDEAHALLCDDEIERARRYKFARDRRRFVAGRAFLRRTLAEHLSVNPRELDFVYGPFGKPELLLSKAGFQHKEIADLLGKSQAAVAKTISRGRAAKDQVAKDQEGENE